ncbi:hypothetical protein [Neobacillus mesonae]|uniref:hypothetical protein n=1 Tax=Neobacillus mesonae TaxID=1193713 RepID=UPI00203F4862|nr:hypothetical protein [Neobacillus mesonae]MCM3569326.1 hypothetical protein [Neobacillus mesonae]
MGIDLLTKLEEEKDQWIYKALARFDEEFLRFNGQDWLNELSAGETPEHQIIQMKKMQYSIYRKKSLDLEQIDQEIKRMKKSLTEEENSYQELTLEAQTIQEEITHFQGLIKNLDKLQLEKFQCEIHTKFELDPKKEHVVFKDRKTSKLIECFNKAEWAMAEFYKEQLEESVGKLKQMMHDAAPPILHEIQTNPPAAALSLKHGRGFDQYIVLKNFEEDFKIVADTFNRNNTIAYNYYADQLNCLKELGKRELTQLCDRKKTFQSMAVKKAEKKQTLKRQKVKWIAKLEERRSKVEWAWNQDLEQLQKLDTILKEEFVQAVSEWQAKLLAKESTDLERWMYYQYCQIILKQAERIIENEYFEYSRG